MRVQELLEQFCPDGVPHRALGELGSFFGGLTGKTKPDFSGGNAPFVSYVSVYKNIAVSTSDGSMVKIAPGEKQRQLRRGDVLFTGSSETPEEVGMSSVVTVEPREATYLNSFCVGFRPDDVTLLDPEFAKYLFRSTFMRTQIIAAASGVTRYNLSKERLGRVRLPLPPREVQAEIARTLDLFAGLQHDLDAELRLELDARERQYAHCRDVLVAQSLGGEPPLSTLGELGEFIRGRRFTKRDIVETGLPSIHYGEIYTHYGVAATEAISHVRLELGPQLRFAQHGDVVIAAVGETVEDVAKAVAWLGSEPVAIHDDTFLFRAKMNPKFVSYALQTRDFHAQKNKHVARAKVKRLSSDGLARITIPNPPRPVQDRVVALLDELCQLVDELKAQLRHELAAREQQYLYYRDELLAFAEVPS